jgi:hypothetical protein
MKKIFLTLALVTGLMVSAQVKIGANETNVNANSILELESTTKGVLFPRVELTGTANVAPLAAHVQGMTVYNTATAGDVTPGMYTNSGTAWVKLGSSKFVDGLSSSDAIFTSGNVGIGVTAPSEKLEVNGAIKVGESSIAPTAGVIRFNTTTNTFEGYDGTAWQALN